MLNSTRAHLHSPVHHSPRHSMVRPLQQEGLFMAVLGSNYDSVINIIVLLGAPELATLSSTCKLFGTRNLPHFHSSLSLVEYTASLRCKHAVLRCGPPLSAHLSASAWQRLFYSVERDFVLGRAPGAFAAETKLRITTLFTNYFDAMRTMQWSQIELHCITVRACIELTHTESDTPNDSNAFSVYPRLGTELLSAILCMAVLPSCSQINRQQLAVLIFSLVGLQAVANYLKSETHLFIYFAVCLSFWLVLLLASDWL